MFCAVYQNAVPKAKNTVVPKRTAVDTGRRPIIHQHSATSIAARIVNSSWSSVANPNTATNGTSSTAGSGGKGISPRSMPSMRPTGSTSWKNQLPIRSAVVATG